MREPSTIGFQIATGTGLATPSPTSVPPNTTGIGGVGFRAGTMPVVVQITDAVSHAPGETEVRFFVRALNDFLPQTGEAQFFRATIRVLAGGCTALDQREVLILVPPTPIVIQ